MKKFKMLVSGILTAAMVLGSTIAYANPAPSIVSGTNTVTNPTFAVLLPTAPAIRLNPFQIGTTETVVAPQVSAGWSVIANRSNIPVSVEVRVAPATTAVNVPAVTGAGARPAHTVPLANFVATEAAAEGRDVFLQFTWASAFHPTRGPSPNVTNTSAAAALSNPELWDDDTDCADSNFALTIPFNADGPMPAHIVPVLTAGVATNTTHESGVVTAHATRLDAADRGGHAFRVLLDAHNVNTDTGAVIAGDLSPDQATAFTFSGAVDYTESWAAGAVNARVIFDITGVSVVTYDGIVAGADAVGNAHRVFAVAP